MTPDTIRWIGRIMHLVLFVVLLFFMVCYMTWMVRNPTANQMTFYTHFSDMVHFRKLPQFQESP